MKNADVRFELFASNLDSMQLVAVYTEEESAIRAAKIWAKDSRGSVILRKVTTEVIWEN